MSDPNPEDQVRSDVIQTVIEQNNRTIQNIRGADVQNMITLARDPRNLVLIQLLNQQSLQSIQMLNLDHNNLIDAISQNPNMDVDLYPLVESSVSVAPQNMDIDVYPLVPTDDLEPHNPSVTHDLISGINSLTLHQQDPEGPTLTPEGPTLTPECPTLTPECPTLIPAIQSVEAPGRLPSVMLTAYVPTGNGKRQRVTVEL